MRLLSAFLLPAAVLSAQVPTLVCQLPSHGFGRMLQGTKATHTFLLENRGVAPIRIHEVKASCDCTTAPLTQHELKPGGTLPLVVTFDARTFEGPVEKSIAVLSDDPARPALVLDLRAHVIRPYRTEPSLLRFPPSSRHARLVLPLRLRAESGEMPPAVAARLEGDDAFEVETHPLGEEKAREVLLTLRPDQGARRVEARLVMVLNDASRTRLEVPVSGELVDDVAVHPARLDFGRAKAEQGLAQKLHLLIHHPDVLPQEVRASVPWLTATLAPRRALDLPGKERLSTSRGFTVSFQTAAQAPAGRHAVTLSVSTTSRVQGRIEVPCTIEVE